LEEEELGEEEDGRDLRSNSEAQARIVLNCGKGDTVHSYLSYNLFFNLIP